MRELITAATAVSHTPTDIVLDANRVIEDTFNGEAIGQLTAADPDEVDYFTFSLVDDAGGRFTIDEFGQLVVANAALIDYETVQSHTVIVRVTDNSGLTFDKSFAIMVVDSSADGKATGPLLFGSDGADVLSGTAGNDTIDGFFGNDFLQSFAGDDILYGHSDDDVLEGGDGSDWLVGGYGRDVLFGGNGKDRFAFDVKPDRKDLDKIADFSVKDDTIFLNDAWMTKIASRVGSRAVKLKKEYFVIGNKAKDENDYVIYDARKGFLYYDKNGSSAGGAVAIATLYKNLKMTAADFLIY
ncbi:calcium-binding protein [Microvirga sp. CF3016]|uniref:calcium-binding protein n=1 Tax=Microvirga sp. CF3016 TaxID=3110181 RepID=UPI002E7687CA|nr:hypothetical protein [Microvirga sp. CF3016]MEE1611340.1 hypothetical protein [Microvirga sp. CF3016]